MDDYQKFVIDTGKTGWEENDSLNKEALKGNDVIDIKWPNEEVTRHRVYILKSHITVSDMGHPWKIPTSHAYIDIPINGTKIEMRLVDIPNILGKKAN